MGVALLLFKKTSDILTQDVARVETKGQLLLLLLITDFLNYFCNYYNNTIQNQDEWFFIDNNIGLYNTMYHYRSLHEVQRITFIYYKLKYTIIK